MVNEAVLAHAPVEIWPESARIWQEIAETERLFLFLDFDGVLAPIVRAPSMAAISRENRLALTALAARRDVVAVIVSGRAVEDLRMRTNLPVIYAGDHGLEIQGGGLAYVVPEARESRPQLLEICNRLRARLERFRGALVECKRLSATVHVRQAESADVPRIEEIVQAIAGEYLAFRVSHGRKVFEIRPAVEWHKGAAAKWILRRLEGTECDAIGVGDDRTDEDLFAELPGGITIRVGLGGMTCAQFWMHETDVARFLRFVDAVLESKRRALVATWKSNWREARSI